MAAMQGVFFVCGAKPSASSTAPSISSSCTSLTNAAGVGGCK